jgi:hypothetical protein
MKKNHTLFVGAWGCAAGIALSLVFYGLFLVDTPSIVYTTIAVDAGPIIKTIAQETSQTEEGSISAIKIEELKEWVLRLPVSGIKKDKDTVFATVFDSGSTKDKRVVLGAIGDSYAEVKAGLKFGDIVVLKINNQ